MLILLEITKLIDILNKSILTFALTMLRPEMRSQINCL